MDNKRDTTIVRAAMDQLYRHLSDTLARSARADEGDRESDGAAQSGRGYKGYRVSNYSVDQIRQFTNEVEIATIQNPYNIFERSIEEAVLPYSQRNNLTLRAYRSLCQGLLTGQLKEDTDYSGHVVKKDDPKYRQPRYNQYLAAVKKLDELARAKYECGVLDLAIQWILDNKGTIALWGAWKPEYLERVNEVICWNIDSETRKEIDTIVTQTIHDPVGSEFLAPPTRGNRGLWTLQPPSKKPIGESCSQTRERENPKRLWNKL